MVAPPSIFFGLVVGTTKPGGIIPPGWAVISVRSDVVDVLDQSFAKRGSTNIVTQHHELAQAGWKDSSSRLQADELVSAWVGEEPAQEDHYILIG